MKTRIDFYDYRGKHYYTLVTKQGSYANGDSIIFQSFEHSVRRVVTDLDIYTVFVRAYRTAPDES